MAQLTRTVPFFPYPQVFKAYETELTRAFKEVAGKGAFIMQQEVNDFEDSLRKLTGAKYALGVSNATDGLIIALRALPLGSGDEVVFASHTFVATAAAVHFAGGVPVPADCGSDHLIDPDSVERAITSRTRVIMPTQLNGRTADMDRLKAIAREHNLAIVEDAAQGLGSKFKSQCAGTFGVAGAISFYPAKNLGAMGDAGAILTNDGAIYERMCLLRDHGRHQTGEVKMWGMNARLDNLQAAFLNLKIQRYAEIVEKRRHVASLYQELLGGVRELALPPAPGSHPDHFDVFQNYEIEAERRDELKKHLHDNRVGTLIQWGGKAVHQFTALGFKVSLPNTEKMFTRCLMLPMNDFLSDQDVRYVCEQVRHFYRS
ncbi:MAG TPA: DegT/DnrJ/EryC1/StrS family aminotransferase [Bdellovibrionota bacterium]|nr:DegT/DnrJ/EryC1/StrS family aminotransferase [Bdellovibrionota bacterium]